jgi:hypothetical protein
MLSLKIQVMKGVQFELEVSPADTVEGLKKQIVAARPELEGEIKIVHNGKVFPDSIALKDGFKPKYPVVVVASKEVETRTRHCRRPSHSSRERI